MKHPFTNFNMFPLEELETTLKNTIMKKENLVVKHVTTSDTLRFIHIC